MNELTWKYVKPLSNPTAIDEFEKAHGVVPEAILARWFRFCTPDMKPAHMR